VQSRFPHIKFAEQLAFWVNHWHCTTAIVSLCIVMLLPLAASSQVSGKRSNRRYEGRVIFVSNEHVIFVDLPTDVVKIRLAGISEYSPAATDEVKKLVLQKTVVLVQDVGATEHSSGVPYYCYTKRDNVLINTELVRKGLAKASKKLPATMAKKFGDAEEFARINNIGLWARPETQSSSNEKQSRLTDPEQVIGRQGSQGIWQDLSAIGPFKFGINQRELRDSVHHHDFSGTPLWIREIHLWPYGYGADDVSSIEFENCDEYHLPFVAKNDYVPRTAGDAILYVFIKHRFERIRCAFVDHKLIEVSFYWEKMAWRSMTKDLIEGFADLAKKDLQTAFKAYSVQNKQIDATISGPQWNDIFILDERHDQSELSGTLRLRER